MVVKIVQISPAVVCVFLRVSHNMALEGEIRFNSPEMTHKIKDKI